MHIDRSRDSLKLLSRFASGAPTQSDLGLIAKRLAVLTADLQRTLLPLPYVAPLKGLERFILEGLQRWSPAIAWGRLKYYCDLMQACPELVLPLGYDEVRFNAPPIVDPTLSESVAGLTESMQTELLAQLQRRVAELSLPVTLDTFHWQTQYRSVDGLWHDLLGVLDKLLPPQTAPGEGETRPEEEWAELIGQSWLEEVKRSSTPQQGLVTLPGLILPTTGDSQLHLATRAILYELYQNKASLATLNWRTLEEIVAELLRGLGLKVHVTPRSGDGGRDVIARGELIPGEPVLLAVEVKHKRVVEVRDLRAALWANRHFPALLFATSGRFSAGVYRERTIPETNLRMILKDGQGLGQWIDQYVKQSYRHGG